jgi:hypothetical protein
VEIWAPHSALSEFEWKNLNGEPKHYESLIHFKIAGMNYAVKKIGSAACKAANNMETDAEYDGEIPIKEVTILPEF